MERSGRFISLFITGILVLGALFFLGSGILLLGIGRLETARWLVELLHRPEKLELVRTVHLTPNRFFLLLIGLLLSGGVLAFLGYISRLKRRQISRLGSIFWAETKRLITGFLQQFRGLSGPEKLLLGLFAGGLLWLQIYLLRFFPAHTDEAFSYVFFVHKGWLTVISYYPLPNNHVFYNLLCLPFEAAGLPPLLVMRIPTLICSWLVLVFLFGLTRKISGFKAAFLAIVFFGAGIQSLYFAVHGRGYMLLTLFGLIAGFAVYKFTLNRRKIYLVVFALAAALGFYTVPVFAYAFASMVSFGAGYLLFYRQFRDFRSLVLAVISAIGLTILFYVPILITTGLSTFLGPDIQQVAAQDFGSLIGDYLQKMPDSFWGLGKVSWLIPLAAFALLWSKNKAGKPAFSPWGLFLVWMSISAVLWVLLSQVMPPLRTWLYWSLFASWGAAVLVAVGLEKVKISETWKLTALLLIALNWVALEVNGLKSKVASGEIQVFWPLPQIIDDILESPAQRVFAGHEFYDLFLQFNSLRTGRPLKVDLYEFRPSPPYDYLLVPLKKPFPAAVDSSLYRQVFRDHALRAYRLKSLPEQPEPNVQMEKKAD